MTEPQPSIGLAEFNSAVTFVADMADNQDALRQWCEARSIDRDALAAWSTKQTELCTEMASRIFLARAPEVDWDPEQHVAVTVFVGLVMGFQVGVELEKGRRDREHFGG